MAAALLSPVLFPIQEWPRVAQERLETLSDLADGSSSHVGSCINSVANSVTSDSRNSMTSDSRKSGMTGGNLSAFTAPPRYRNSGVFVHGTKFRNFASIMEQGLKAAKSDIFMIDEVRQDGRVPGLRDPPQILIFIDENKARSENMEFEYDACQGTWKTKGINGVIRPWFFQKVVDQRRGPGRGNVLFQSKEDPIMQANAIQGLQQPQYLLHATYWENVHGILREGILPAKNPTSSFRQPFKDLLQGAESHVYTVSLQGQNRSQGVDAALRQRKAETPVVPEDREQALFYKLDKETVGLERPPDAYFVIDTQKAKDLGLNLDLVQSVDREDCVFVQGKVPVEALATVQVNEPVNLPDELKARIVDPRSFNEIPIIDLSLDEDTVVEQFRYACEDVGFMQVTGHGVSDELQEQHAELQRRFFALPEAAKRRLALHEGSPVRGYFGKGGEDLDQVLSEKVDSAEGQKIARQARKDNKEAMDMNGASWSRPQGGYVAEIFGQPSALLAEDELPGFHEVMEQYSSEMFRISRRVLSFLARVLGKAPDYFEQYLTNPVATHRLLHYWPIQDFSSQIGVGEHSDYGLLTILRQDAVGGLQVLNAKDSRWVHCCPIPNAFVVNLGDMMSRWTAHRFKSTIHRVVNISPMERFSAPYFLEPNMDALIEHGGLCDGPSVQRDLGAEGQGGCRRQVSGAETPTAEDILERFYRASGQLKFGPRGAKEGSS